MINNFLYNNFLFRVTFKRVSCISLLIFLDMKEDNSEESSNDSDEEINDEKYKRDMVKSKEIKGIIMQLLYFVTAKNIFITK